MDPAIEGYMAVLWDNSIWMAKGTEIPRPGVSRMIPYRFGPDARRIRGFGEGLRLAYEIYPWLIEHDRCIDLRIPLIPLDMVKRIINPLKAARHASGTVQRFLDLLSETRPGLTGSLALGLRGHDIDVIIYGLSESRKAYETLQELRIRGVTKPLEGPALVSEYSKNIWDTPVGLAEYKRIVQGKVLLGIYEGMPYSVRLVARRKPRICRDVVHKLGWCRLRARVTGAETPYMTPTTYSIEVLEASGRWRNECLEAGILETHRIRFMEYTEGTCIDVIGIVELRTSGTYVIIPDYPGGMVKPCE